MGALQQTPTGSVDSKIELFHSRLRDVIGRAKWETWIKPLEVLREEDTLTLEAPNRFNATWVIDNYTHQINEIASSVWPQPFEVSVTVAPQPEPDTSPIETKPYQGTLDDHARQRVDEPLEQRDTSNLLARYSFENFVVGPSNRFAHAASQAVAEQPGRHYNPLFIYAGSGLGKTHLLHAVGQHRLELSRSAVVKYVTSENFFNDFINSIRRKTMDDFKARYRKANILLVDDVQFFEGKEMVLEEFFHTFNSLYEAGNQLVISSDRSPRELKTIEDRLRSRFEWGLTTDIQSPDVETRLAILRKNAEAGEVRVPQDVLGFIAENVADNIRELEGALTRVSAFATLTHERVTLDLATNVLQDVVKLQSAAPLTSDTIISAVAQYYEIPKTDIVGGSRRQPLARQRQVGMYLCRENTGLSLPRIGAAFGGRDHTTVMHAVEKITNLLQTDKAVYDQVTAITQQLRTT
ncbi:MAG: chromosomal replication initiator protein DnaA [Acidimicrobiia bacterium]|nr:chromosomal replication initiator protein DnaA [Acidimicrobiia bacterium]